MTIKRGQVLPQLYVWMFCIDVEVLREREREKYTVIRMCCCLNHTVSFISFHYLGTGIVIILCLTAIAVRMDVVVCMV